MLVQVRQLKSAILYSRLTSCLSEQEEIVKLHHAVSVKLVSVKFASPAKSLEKGSKCHLFYLLHFKVFDKGLLITAHFLYTCTSGRIYFIVKYL